MSGGGKVVPWPPLARQCFHFAYLCGSFFEFFLFLFTYFSRTLKTKILQYLPTLFKILSIKKALNLSPVFCYFFDLLLGPPFGERLAPTWRPRVPTWPRHVDFGAFLGSPFKHQNDTLGCPAALKSIGAAPWAPRWGSRGHPWRTLCPKEGPGKDFCRFCDPLGSLRVPF